MAIRRTLAEFSDDIATADIADDAVTTAKIAADAITTAEIADSVTLVTPNIGTPSAGVVTNLSGVLPAGVTGGSGLTALGTVTAGNLANTAIVYPAGHVLKQTNLFNDNNSSIPITAVNTWTNTGLEIEHETVRSSTDSYLVVEWSVGLTFRTQTSGSWINITMTAASDTTWDADDSLAKGGSNMEYSAGHNTSQYMPRYAKTICGISPYTVPVNKTTWSAGESLFFRLWGKVSGDPAYWLFVHGGASHTFSVTEVER